MELIEERHNKYKEEVKEQYSKKLAKNTIKYNESLKKFLCQKEEEEKEKELKSIKKYQGYVKIKLYKKYIFLVFYNER